MMRMGGVKYVNIAIGNVCRRNCEGERSVEV